MSSLRARHHTNMMLLFSPCKRCPCPCSDAVLRSCEEALAGIILQPPLPLVCVGSFPLCGTAGSRGGPVVVLVGPAPPVWGSVFYKDMYGMVAAAC